MYKVKLLFIVFRYHMYMGIKDIVHQIHSMLEVKKKGKRIKQDEISKEIGISQRAYAEYYRGNNQPLAMKVLLRMLNKLNDKEIIQVVRMWKESEITKRPDRPDKKGKKGRR